MRAARVGGLPPLVTVAAFSGRTGIPRLRSADQASLPPLLTSGPGHSLWGRPGPRGALSSVLRPTRAKSTLRPADPGNHSCAQTRPPRDPLGRSTRAAPEWPAPPRPPLLPAPSVGPLGPAGSRACFLATVEVCQEVRQGDPLAAAARRGEAGEGGAAHSAGVGGHRGRGEEGTGPVSSSSPRPSLCLCEVVPGAKDQGGSPPDCFVYEALPRASCGFPNDPLVA